MHRRMVVPRPARLWPCVAHAVDVIVLWLYCARIIVCVLFVFILKMMPPRAAPLRSCHRRA